MPVAGSELDRAVDALLKLKAGNTFAPVTVIVPHPLVIRGVERVLAKRLAASKTGLLNVRVVTLPVCIREATAKLRYQAGRTVITTDEVIALAESFLTNGKHPYFTNLANTRSVAQLLARTVYEIRVEAPDSGKVEKSIGTGFGDRGKELAAFLGLYAGQLDTRNMIDYAGEGELFTTLALKKTDTFIVFPMAGVQANARERRCLEHMAARGTLIQIEEAAPGKPASGTIELKAAPFAGLELREIFREIRDLAAGSVPFERVAIICPNDEYLALARSYGEQAGIPCWFPDGLPAGDGPGTPILRALLRTLDTDGLYPHLEELIRLAAVPAEAAGTVSRATLLKFFRKEQVACGLQRLREKLETPTRPPRDEKEEKALAHLKQFLEALIAARETLAGEKPLAQMAAGVATTVEPLLPGFARARMRAFLGRYGADGTLMAFSDVAALILGELDGISAAAGNPEGSVLVTDSLAPAGYDFIFMPGLNDDCYPRAHRENPLLPDEEKRALNRDCGARFPLREEKDLLARQRFFRAVRAAGRRWTGYFAAIAPLKGSSRITTPFYPELFELYTGEPLDVKKMEEFIKSLRAKVGLYPAQPEDAISGTEYHLTRLAAGDRQYYRHLLATVPAFLNADRTRAAAKGPDFDGYSGKLTLMTALPLPGSASGFERFMKCHYQYFLKNVLYVEPLPTPDPFTDIDPLERGILIHAILKEFLELRKGKPVPESDRPRLAAIADRQVAGFLAGRGCANPVLAGKLRGEVEPFLDSFFTWQLEFQERKKCHPAELEYGFGTWVGQAPLPVTIGKKTFTLSGSIDRIDRSPDELVILDYKTSAADKYKDKLYEGGTRLQPFLYAAVAAAREKKRRILTGYLTLKEAAEDHLCEYTAEVRGVVERIIGYMERALAAGLFIADPDACEYCDYAGICLNRWQAGEKLGQDTPNRKLLDKLLEIRELG